jgi:hypothetical protein
MSIERVDNGSTYGHAVLVDGYGYSADDFYMHVNFGWGGGSDAWYMPPNIKNYSTIKGFVFNVFPSSTGSILSGRVLDASGVPIAGAPVTLKRNATPVDTATTDAHGIYAFVAAAGSYLVSAAAGGETAVVGAEVAETVGTRLAENIGYYNYSMASIGNSYDNDIHITGIAGAAPPVFSPERRRIVRPVVVLPQPDSPTRPIVVPRFRLKVTPSTALTFPMTRESMPPLIGKYFFRPFTIRMYCGS